uniref:Uncharacterized protein n=1 Tax=Myripristis murdjan TaxID=586833 RepID=A0A667WU81_9TELE
MSPSASSLLLLQLLSLLLRAVAMPTCELRGNVVQEAHDLLRDLGGPLPVHCLQYNSVVSFPSSALPAGSGRPQCRRTLWVVYETLKGAGQVFEDNEVPVGEGGVSWDSQKLDNFQNLLYRLVEDGSCVSTNQSISQSINHALTNGGGGCVLWQGSAGCGWLLLRRDLLLALRSGLQQHHLSCFS